MCGYGAYSIKCQISVTKRQSSSRMCLVKSCFRFGTAVVTLDQERLHEGPHVQHRAAQAGNRDLHQVRPERGRSRSASGSLPASARPATPGKRAPTGTPADSCATSSRRAGAWMARLTRRRTQPLPCSTADRAGASAGSARRRSSAHRRCTCSENPPLKSPAYPYCSHRQERDHTNGGQQDTEHQFT